MFGQTIEAAAAAEEAAVAVKGTLSAAVALLLVVAVVVVDDGAAILPLAGTTTCRCCWWSGRIRDDADRTGAMAFYNCTAVDGKVLAADGNALAAAAIAACRGRVWLRWYRRRRSTSFQLSWRAHVSQAATTSSVDARAFINNIIRCYYFIYTHINVL